MDEIDDTLRKAALDYLARKEGDLNEELLQLTSDGLWVPRHTDRCPDCMTARWSSRSANHLKSIEHVAKLYHVKPRDLERAAVALQGVATGPDCAWKQLEWSPDQQRLYSPYDNYIWNPSVINYAECIAGHEGVPLLECSCGFYFYWTPKRAMTHFGTHITVSGIYVVTVRANVGGNMIEASLGCRAEAAVITGVLDMPHLHDCVPDHEPVTLIDRITTIYDIPILTPKEVGIYEPQ